MNATGAPSSPTVVGDAAAPSPDPYADFRAGTTAALRSWSALRTAVEQLWGGTESAAKAEDLRSNIFQFFDGTSPKAKMSPEELEDNLLAYMEEEFGVVLEDGSEREVASLVCAMYDACAGGNVALAREVVRNAMRAEEALGRSNVKSVIQNGEDGDDDMEDDSDAGGGTDAALEGDNTGRQAMGEATIDDGAASAYASETLFGGPPKPRKELPPPRQLGEPAPERPPPAVDDDGFATVVTKKKGGKR